jgi:protein-tyrosine phosphatase
MDWLHLPIVDYSVPTSAFERDWAAYGAEVRTLLRKGADIGVHCKGGLGRAGMIAARILAELGMPPDAAIRIVRQVRKGAIETADQEDLVRRTTVIPDPLP